MLSTLYREQFSTVGESRNRSNNLKSYAAGRLDELAVFGLVVLAVLYVAVASCWFIF